MVLGRWDGCPAVEASDKLGPMKLRLSHLGAIAWALIPGAYAGPQDTTVVPPKILEKTFLSPVYHVDKKYRSMKGPQSTRILHLGNPDEEQLMWITGYSARMVSEDGLSPMPQEFMCHSNLDLDPIVHRDHIRAETSISGRLFTLSQGQFDIDFPRGFGIPIRSSEVLNLTTQVLNLNLEAPNLDVRHKVTIRYIKDDSGAIRPLFQKSVYGLALLEGKDGRYGESVDESHHMGDHADGMGCLERPNASTHTYKDGQGRTFTGHWVVSPGREVNTTLVTKLLSLPYDTTVHYIAVHLHPFAESLELKDLTAKKTIFRSEARNYQGKVGLEEVHSFSSPEGIPVFADHEYELISVYNNTSREPQDSMAVMYLYLFDKRFVRPDKS